MVQLTLTAMPAVAAVLFAIRSGVRSEPGLLGIGLAAGGAAAMMTFWVYFGLPAAAGDACAYGLFFGSVGLIAWIWPQLSAERPLLRRLAVPLGLWALATLFVVFYGFVHGGAETAVETASFRFSTNPSPFASDSSIPAFYSDWLFAGSPGSAPVFPPEWLFSDRPPLQVGYTLTQRVFGWDTTGTHYEVLGIALQQLWVVGLWALLVAGRIGGLTRGLVMVAAMVSDVAIVNAFYVWPKLLGAAFVLAALALVTPRDSLLRRQPWTVVLLAVLAALAYLAHGTSVFGLIPVAVLALWRGLPDWRWLAAAVAALALLVVPWSAYQKWGDPPGNRLAKWALAGSAAIDDRGVIETIRDEYAKAGLGESLENKLENFHTMIGGNPAIGEPAAGQVPFGDVITEIADTVDALGDGDYGIAASKVREIRHWHLLWTLGLLILALPLIAIGRLRSGWRESEDWRFARFSALVLAIGIACWGLLMFGSVAGRTVVTQSSLAVPLLMVAAVVSGLRATCPRWAGWFVGANAFTVFLLYLPTLAPTLDNSYSPFELVAAIASLGAFVALSLTSTAPETTVDG